MKLRPGFDTAGINSLAQKLLEQGFPPAMIRKQLAARGMRWEYSYSGRREDGRRAQHQGERERGRRLKAGKLCVRGDGHPRSGTSDLCEGCLREKWGSA